MHAVPHQDSLKLLFFKGKNNLLEYQKIVEAPTGALKIPLMFEPF